MDRKQRTVYTVSLKWHHPRSQYGNWSLNPMRLWMNEYNESWNSTKRRMKVSIHLSVATEFHMVIRHQTAKNVHLSSINATQSRRECILNEDCHGVAKPRSDPQSVHKIHHRNHEESYWNVGDINGICNWVSSLNLNINNRILREVRNRKSSERRVFGYSDTLNIRSHIFSGHSWRWSTICTLKIPENMSKYSIGQTQR